MAGYLSEEEQQEKQREQQRRLSRQQIIEHTRKSLLYTAFDLKWIPVSAQIAVVGHYPNMQGCIAVYSLEDNELRTLSETRKSMPFKACTFGHGPSDGRQLATCDFTGNLHLWDVERGGTAGAVDDKPLVEFKMAHKSMINSIDGCMHDGPPELASGGRDGAVKVWDVRQASKPVLSLIPAESENNKVPRDCWTVRLGNSYDRENRVIAAGYDNGDVKLYDMRMGKMLHEFNVSNGVCDLEFDRNNIEMNKLIVSSLEGRVRVYDLRTLHSQLGYAYVEERVSSGTIWCSRALPQNREVFMSGGAGELTLCKYSYPPERSLKDPQTGESKGVAGTVEELNKAKIGDQPVNSLDWNRNREGLLACAAFDQTLRVLLVTKLSLI